MLGAREVATKPRKEAFCQVGPLGEGIKETLAHIRERYTNCRDAKRLLTHISVEAVLLLDDKRAAGLPETGTTRFFHQGPDLWSNRMQTLIAEAHGI